MAAHWLRLAAALALAASAEAAPADSFPWNFPGGSGSETQALRRW